MIVFVPFVCIDPLNENEVAVGEALFDEESGDFTAEVSLEYFKGVIPEKKLSGSLGTSISVGRNSRLAYSLTREEAAEAILRSFPPINHL